jgi:hypothetical protein
MATNHAAPTILELQQQVSELSRTMAVLIQHLSAAVSLLQPQGAPDIDLPEATWNIRQPKRNDALSWPIFLVLKDAHRRGQPKPTAMGVMESFGKKCPPEVIEIMPREVKYYSLTGELKSAGLPEIRSRIYRMTAGK